MNLREVAVRVALRMVLGLAVLAGVVFGCAGRWDLPLVWAVCGMFAAAMLGSLASIDRGLMQERMRPGPGGKDRYLRVIVLPLFAAHLAVPGLDRRYEWTQLSMWMQSAGLAGLPLAFSLSIWAARVNRFFSPVVRLQPERGHQVVTTGPYAVNAWHHGGTSHP